jgi:phosphoribosyl-ATP pyrophosphohydrolase
MIIPSIDLMGGRAVQLRKGREHVLTDPRDPLALCAEFHRYGEVAAIDLDAALSQGDNLELLRQMCRVADVRVGGGIRDLERARLLLRAGARRLIIGTAADPELLGRLPRDRVMVALDTGSGRKDGEVLERGWTQGSGETLLDRARRLAPYCSSYLCTFVEREGGMGGLPAEEVAQLQAELPHPLTVAGGVASGEEAAALCRLGVDVQVGMALYTGKLDLADVVAGTVDFEKAPLVPTIVQDQAGQVLMLAYSSPESLRAALRRGEGIYHSRSRQALWVKGEQSGHRQRLISCRMDCDRDSLLFTVAQSGPACHTGSHSCFGGRRFTLARLFEVLAERRRDLPQGSYTATLLRDREQLLRKIMEEAFEVTRAGARDDLVWEIADAVYFLSVLATAEGIELTDIEAELAGRHRQ